MGRQPSGSVKGLIKASINSQTSHSQTIYVDSNIGEDKNSGTKESPVYSINKAIEIIRSRRNNICLIKSAFLSLPSLELGG